MSASHGQSLDTRGVGLTREDLPALGDSPELSRLDPRQFWDEGRRALPIDLEIGSGKGTFLVQQGEQTPEVNYLGIEYAREFWRYAADRVRRRGLPNVRLLHYDAKVFVKWYAADAVFRQIHIYFPDPWPKKRHHKRRLIEVDFLRECHRVLRPEGMIRIVTDHEEYFAWMGHQVEQVTVLFDRRSFERPVSADAGEVVGTNFERKYRREGRPFQAMTLRKR